MSNGMSVSFNSQGLDFDFASGSAGPLIQGGNLYVSVCVAYLGQSGVHPYHHHDGDRAGGH
jgi:hypothetical protein